MLLLRKGIGNVQYITHTVYNITHAVCVLSIIRFVSMYYSLYCNIIPTIPGKVTVMCGPLRILWEMYD